jgi:hypothetical protein
MTADPALLPQKPYDIRSDRPAGEFGVFLLRMGICRAPSHSMDDEFRVAGAVQHAVALLRLINPRVGYSLRIEPANVNGIGQRNTGFWHRTSRSRVQGVAGSTRPSSSGFTIVPFLLRSGLTCEV